VSKSWQRNTNFTQNFQSCQPQGNAQESLEKLYISQVKDAPKATYLHDTHRLGIALNVLQKHAGKLLSIQVENQANDLLQIIQQH